MKMKGSKYSADTRIDAVRLFYSGVSQEEISARLGIPVNSVKYSCERWGLEFERNQIPLTAKFQKTIVHRSLANELLGKGKLFGTDHAIDLNRNTGHRGWNLRGFEFIDSFALHYGHNRMIPRKLSMMLVSFNIMSHASYTVGYDTEFQHSTRDVVVGLERDISKYSPDDVVKIKFVDGLVVIGSIKEYDHDFAHVVTRVATRSKGKKKYQLFPIFVFLGNVYEVTKLTDEKADIYRNTDDLSWYISRLFNDNAPLDASEFDGLSKYEGCTIENTAVILSRR